MASPRKKQAKKIAASSKARGDRLIIQGPHPSEVPEPVPEDWKGMTWEEEDAIREEYRRVTAMARAGDSAAKMAKATGITMADARSYVTEEKRRLRLIERRAPFPLRKAAVEAFKAILAHENVPVERAEMDEDENTFDIEITMDPEGVYDVDAMVEVAEKESGLRDYYGMGGSGAGFGVRDITYVARSKPRKRGAKGWTGNPPASRRKASQKKPAKKDRRKLLSRLLRGT